MTSSTRLGGSAVSTIEPVGPLEHGGSAPDHAEPQDPPALPALPDLAAAHTPAEYVEAVRAFKLVHGHSLRDLQRRTGLPRTTIAHMLDPTRLHLPPLDRTVALLRACGASEAELRRWAEAWTRIQLATAKRSAATRTGVRTDTDSAPSATAATDAAQAPTPTPTPTPTMEPLTPEASATPPTQPPPAAAAAAGTETSTTEAVVPEVATSEATLAAALPTGTVAVKAPARTRHPRRHSALTHGAALVAGLLFGAGAALTFTGGIPKGLPGYVPEPDPCSAGAAALTGSDLANTAAADSPPTAAAPSAAGSPTPVHKWIARRASDEQILTRSDVVLPIEAPVVRHDALIVTVMLTSTCPGRVTVTDTQGDHYQVVGDVTDSSRHRVLILAAFDVNPLTTADAVQVKYPPASKYHVAVDEFQGVTVVGGTAGASGKVGGTAFTTSSTPLHCAAGDLLVTAVGTNSGTPPVFSPGWTALPELKLSSYRLTTAYQLAAAEGPCAATGTTPAEWAAVVTSFR